MDVFRNSVNSERMKMDAMYTLDPPGYRPGLNFLPPTDRRQIHWIAASPIRDGSKDIHNIEFEI
jgi:hypothetical protein